MAHWLPDRDATGEGWYVQGTYRLRPSVGLMLRYEEGYADTADRDGSKLEAKRAAWSQRTPVLQDRLRRHPLGHQPHWMVRAEYAYNNGTFVLSPRENLDPLARERYWNLFSLQIAFRF
jgi:hypothetical protein